MKHIIVTALMLLSATAMAQDVAGTISFDVGEVTTCAPATDNFVCLPVTEYRVYVAGSPTQLGLGKTGGGDPIPFAIEAGTEYCFEATAYNGNESGRTDPACKTWEIGTPNIPTSLSFDITFGSG